MEIDKSKLDNLIKAAEACGATNVATIKINSKPSQVTISWDGEEKTFEKNKKNEWEEVKQDYC